MSQQKRVFHCSHCGYLNIFDKNYLLLCIYQISGDIQNKSHFQTHTIKMYDQMVNTEFKYDIWYLSFLNQSVLSIPCKHYTT